MSRDTDNRQFIHRIDRQDRICFVNRAWLAFAEENDWETSAEEVLGCDILSQIADARTRHVYRLLIDRIRDRRCPAKFRYRCDSPARRRFMEMRMNVAKNGQVEFLSRVLRIEQREPIAVLDAARRQRSGGVLPICSWCKAVWVETAWVELEEAMKRTDILARAPLPPLSHGICPACSERMTQLGERP
jgi:hypothetical protein